MRWQKVENRIQDERAGEHMTMEASGSGSVNRERAHGDGRSNKMDWEETEEVVTMG